MKVEVIDAWKCQDGDGYTAMVQVPRDDSGEEVTRAIEEVQRVAGWIGWREVVTYSGTLERVARPDIEVVKVKGY